MNFRVLLKTLKNVSFFQLEKKIEKENDKEETYNKVYSTRFIDSTRLMNASLDTHVNNPSRKIYNQKCKRSDNGVE